MLTTRFAVPPVSIAAEQMSAMQEGKLLLKTLRVYSSWAQFSLRTSHEPNRIQRINGVLINLNRMIEFGFEFAELHMGQTRCITSIMRLTKMRVFPF